MRLVARALGLGLLLALAGCAQEKEWMKVGQPYTTEEFRRDYAECSRGGSLDESCMRSRGWVSVSPGRVEKPLPAPDPRRPGRY
jgi:hypothetical protein